MLSSLRLYLAPTLAVQLPLLPASTFFRLVWQAGVTPAKGKLLYLLLAFLLGLLSSGM